MIKQNKVRAPKVAPMQTPVEAAPVVAAPVAVQQKPAVEAKVSRKATQKWASKDRMAEIKPTDRIVLAVRENPKRSQPKDRFQLYFTEGGLTVSQYIEKVTEMGKAGVKGSNATVAKADLSWDLGHGFITIEPGTEA
jgi:hypothetical protein